MDKILQQVKEEVEGRIRYWESHTKLQVSQCNYTEAARSQQSEKCYRSLLVFIENRLQEKEWKDKHG